MKIRQLIYTLLIGIVAMLSTVSVQAETVSQKEASRLAGLFFNTAYGRVMSSPKLVFNGRKLTTDRLFSPFYIYNHPAGGFVIVSADNKAFPILGYSLKENFDPENMSGSVETLLREYAKDIEFIRHDSRIPDRAVAAWTNLPEYIDGIINSPYLATDILISEEDSKEIVSNLETTGRWVDVSSDIYTPQQWAELINEQMDRNGNVVVGFVGRNEVFPSVLHGRKGDYYRISFQNENDWLMRLAATEFFNDGQIADLEGITPEELMEEAPEPFADYEDFIKTVAQEEETRQRRLEEKLIPSSPIIKNVGGGRYEIILPEKLLLARIYNLAGSMVGRQVYKDSSIAEINLEGQPYGFYFVLLNGESGKSYGFKLSR